MYNYDMGGGIRYDSAEYSEKILGNADGGPGSGNWGHGGRPGKRGGSTGGGGKQHRTGTKESGFSSEAKERAKAKAAKSGSGAKNTGMTGQQRQEKRDKGIKALTGSPTFSKPISYMDKESFYFTISKVKANSYGDVGYSAYFRAMNEDKGYYQSNILWSLKEAKSYVKDKISNWE